MTKRLNTMKRQSERLRRRKATLFKKAWDLGRECNVDVAVIICQRGRYYTFRSLDNKSWPPSMIEIVSNFPWDSLCTRWCSSHRKTHIPFRKICSQKILRTKQPKVEDELCRADHWLEMAIVIFDQLFGYYDIQSQYIMSHFVVKISLSYTYYL